ncbi:SDR family NAD(P)-dependent oxidoreductase [Nocardia vinacea]|uniref:SDR family NAD(P)-dependent oxidoreductase n=1 Tax=Nocardia vinacea TaxID=96468 RepID=UPI0002F8EFDE|nr:SDR family NAD(P)-dependent oxidoreductase [Nocardia vinacea]
MDDKSDRIMVMTGATSGLGAYALNRLALAPGTRVIVGARGSEWQVPAGVEVLPLDLASLADVRSFAEAVARRVGNARIDILVLNAGVQTPTADRRSVDGFELTFAVNHLAHYLLVQLLLPLMAESGRLVITTSNLHESAPTPFDPAALAHPDGSRRLSGIRAYSASKLCNLLTAQAISALDETEARALTVIAYNPGMTEGTSLMNEQPKVVRAIMQSAGPIFRLLGAVRPGLYMATPERSGNVLAELASGAATPPAGKIYASLVKGELTFPTPSDLARSSDARDLLWRESAAMVGLQPEHGKTSPTRSGR